MAKKQNKCLAKNGKGKCIVYKRKHTNDKALKAHKKALKKRGATITEKNVPGGVELQYHFKK